MILKYIKGYLTSFLKGGGEETGERERARIGQRRATELREKRDSDFRNVRDGDACSQGGALTFLIYIHFSL